jgi:hypothetical protein
MSRVPSEQELRQYLAAKDVQALFESLMEVICIDRPHDVPSYLVQYLEKNFTVKRGSKKGSAPVAQPVKAQPAPAKKTKPAKEELNGPFKSNFTFGQKDEQGTHTTT